MMILKFYVDYPLITFSLNLKVIKFDFVRNQLNFIELLKYPRPASLFFRKFIQKDYDLELNVFDFL